MEEETSDGQSVAADGANAFELDAGHKIRILDLVARGGMGTVYRAYHSELDREVAVKILHPQLVPRPDHLERFRREMTVCASLDHPNIVQVYSAGVAPSGIPFLVMEYLEGENLSEIIARDGPLNLDRFFRIFQQVAAAVEYAHGKGIIHRDIKPSNIIVVSQNGQETAKLIDFGVAKLVAESVDQNLTRTGALLGSSCYMSPEQCSADPVDARSDIYSLGCVMYESLTGRLPFRGESALEVMYSRLHDSLSSRDWKRVPKPVSLLIGKCLRRSPDDRFESAAQLAVELRSCPRLCTDLGDRKGTRFFLWATAGTFGMAVLLICCLKPSPKPVSTGTAVGGEQEFLAGSSPLPKDIAVPRPIKEFRALLDRYACKQERQAYLQSDRIHLARRWLELYGSSPSVPRRDVAEVSVTCGKAALFSNDRTLADYYLRRGLALAPEGDARVDALYGLACIEEGKQHYDQAIGWLKEAVSILERNPSMEERDSRKQACLDILGHVYLKTGNWIEAGKCFEQEQAVLRLIGSWGSQYANSCRQGLAAVAARNGHGDQASKLLATNLQVLDKLDADPKASRQGNLAGRAVAAEYFWQIGEPNRAADVFLRCAEAREAGQDEPQAAVWLLNAAALKFQTGDRALANRLTKKFNDMCSSSGKRQQILERVAETTEYELNKRMFKKAETQAKQAMRCIQAQPGVWSGTLIYRILTVVANSGIAQGDIPSTERFLKQQLGQATTADLAACCLLVQGDMYERLARSEESESAYRLGLERKPADRFILGRLYQYLGLAQWSRRDAQGAESSFKKAAAMYSGTPVIRDGLRQALTLLAYAETELNKPEEAVKTIRSALRACSQQDERDLCWLDVISVPTVVGKYDVALKQVNAYLEKLGGSQTDVRVRNQRLRFARLKGTILTRMKEYQEAGEALEPAIVWWSANAERDPEEAAATFSIAAELQTACKELTRAKSYLNEALRCLKMRPGNSSELKQIGILFQLGRLNQASGETSASRETFRQGIDKARRCGTSASLLSAASGMEELAKLRKKDGRTDEAMKLLAESAEIFSRFGCDARARSALRLRDAWLEESRSR